MVFIVARADGDQKLTFTRQIFGATILIHVLYQFSDHFREW